MSPTALAPIVGRDAERKKLLDAWKAVRAGGPGRTALISGKAGIGKSRLAAFIEDVSTKRGGVPLRGTCSEYYSGKSFHVFGRMLDRKCETRGMVDQKKKLEILRDEIEAAGVADALLTPLLAPMMGIAPAAGYDRPQLDSAAYQQASRAAVAAWWEALGKQMPFVAVIEDLQWSDSSSLDLITDLVDPRPDPLSGVMRPGLPEGVLLVVTSRLVDPAADGADDSQDVALTRIAQAVRTDAMKLDPLSTERTVELLSALDSSHALAKDRLETIVARSEGNPLYVEQSLEVGHFASDDTQVPATLPELLKRRVESLSPADLEIAQVAAAVGRAIDVDLLAAVIEKSRDETEGDLRRLVEHQILTESDIGDYVQYAFRHDLIVDQVYSSADEKTRKNAHSSIADALLSEVGMELDPAVAATHLDRAQRYEAAVDQYSAAAMGALGAGASRVAIDLLGRGLEIVPRLEQGADRSVKEMTIHLMRGTGYTAIEGYASENALAEYTNVHRIAGELGSRLESATALLSLIAFHTVVGNRAEAETLISDMYDLAEGAGPEMAAAFDAELHYNSSFHSFFVGDYDASAREYDTALAIFEKRPENQKGFPGVPPPSDSLTGTWANAAPVEWAQGRFSSAESMIRQGIERSRSQAFPVGPFMECYTRAYAGWMHQVAGRADLAGEHFRLLDELGKKHGYGMWIGFAGIHGLITHLHLQEVPEGVDALEQARIIAAATGIRSFQPYFLTEQAELTARVGETEKALELFDQASAVAQEMNELFYQAETLRKCAAVHASNEDFDRASADLTGALTLAAKQGAHVYRLRAATDLSRLPAAARSEDLSETLAAAIGLLAEPENYPEVERARGVLAES